MRLKPLNKRRAGDPDLENDKILFGLDKKELRLFWQALGWFLAVVGIAVFSILTTTVYEMLPLWANWISGAVAVFIAFVPLRKTLTEGSKIGYQAQLRAEQLKAEAGREVIISVWLPL